MRNKLRLVSLFAVLLPASGCSYAFVHGPPAAVPTAKNPPEVQRVALGCTSSNEAPVIDTVLSVLSVGAVVAGSVIYADSKKTTTCSPNSAFCGLGQIGTGVEEATGVGAIIAGGLGTLLFIPSAVTGYGRTAECRRAREVPPAGPAPVARYLLDVRAIAEARAEGLTGDQQK